ncbi:MAG: pseudouridine synthase [Bacteroidales bacterium]|nr:pseudouridine synthase [Bacteroidales bacterium]
MERRFDNNDSDSSYSRREGYDRYDSARREGSRDGSSRFNRSYNREGDSYGNRPRFNRDNNDGEQRPRFNRPRYNQDSDGEQRPRFNRDNEGGYSSRPRYNSNNDGEQRPRFNRDNNRNGYSSRPRYNSDNDGEQRPRFNREGGYSSRPRYNSNNDGEQKPRFNREGGFSSRPRYNSDNNDGERRPSFGNRPRRNTGSNREGGFNKPRNNRSKSNYGGYSESRPRFNKERGFHNYDREEMQQKSSITEDLFMSDEAAIMAAGEEIATPTSNKMRLNRYIAMSGVCSRREADELIKAGKIRLNGNVITEMGVTVQKDDVVEYEGRKLEAERKVYVLLNKPKDVITTTDDPEERRTILDLVEGACDERIYPVGRLDRNTTGVILLTNDGEMTEKLMHPKYGVRKIYHVFLDKHVTEEDMRKMVEGVTLEDGPIAVDDVRYVDNSDKKQVGVQIHSGRNRIVRRIFEHLGYNVERLDRVYFAGLTKLNLPRGKWRFLTDTEVNKLKAGFYK